MRAPDRGASRVLSQLAKYPVQCLPRSSRTSSTACHNSTLMIKHRNGFLRPSEAPHSVSEGSFCSSQRRVFAAGGQITFSRVRRHFSISRILLHNDLVPPKPGEELRATFVDKEGEEHTFEVANGDNLLDIALENDVDMEGACGGSCACSTCHVIVEDEEMYNKMDEPDDDENDMLDLAFGLTETSRLGCQVKMRPDLDGLRVKLPAMTRNMQASDFSKKNERSD